MDQKRQGRGVDYYMDGAVKGISFWEKGVLHGPYVKFYESGDTLEMSEFRYGRCVFTKIFTEDGFLRRELRCDSLGQLFDIYVYHNDGSRDFSRGEKDPIFIPQQDTVVIGEYYLPMIRLGNRQFPIVDVILGDPLDGDIIIKNRPLPKKDLLTSILRVKADSVGIQKVSGVVFEHTEKIDSFDIIPFTHCYFVKPKNQ